MNRSLFILFLFISSTTTSLAQFGRSGHINGIKSSRGDDFSYLNPKEYMIAGITVSGVQFLDKDALITISKLTRGERIMVPGDATAGAIKNLWAQDLLDDVKLNITQIKGDSIYFDIAVVERPRLTRIDIQGLRKGQADDIRSKLDSKKGRIVNQNLLNTITATVKKHFNEKGYLNTDVTITQAKDNDTKEPNNVILTVAVDKHRRTIVHRITFEGNHQFTDGQLRGFLKKTKQQAFYRIFGPGKFVQNKYDESKQALVSKMQERGYKDAEILQDSITRFNDKSVNIHLKIHEGPKYFFGNITWAGNAKYSTKVLHQLLGVEKGEVFSDQRLNRRLNSSPNGDDISSLYMNDGYLTFNIDPVQTKVYGDTIDLELLIYEGPQYTISKVIVKGNELTNDKVILREIRTKPGQKFSKEAIIRSVREIAALKNFDDQKTDPRPININPNEGTVDIEYNVVEKPSDQIELSGGFGGNRVVGTLGLTFNNFSTRNLFNGKAWRPVPKGDGQTLSIRGQTNGKYYHSFNLSFSEPWLGGKKPIYFGANAYTSVQSNGLASGDPGVQRIRMSGVSFSLGKRLKFPDDYFQANTTLEMKQYNMTNYTGFLLANGIAYNINLTQQISRNSTDAPIYPTSGSNLRLTLQATPPYSLLNNVDYLTASDQDKYRFTEYYKWKFESQWFQKIYGKLVLKTQAQFGFLGYYNSAVGQSAFERFKLGGDGMQGFDFFQGAEVISMRGYPNNAVIPVEAANPSVALQSGSPIFNKYVIELRHPITMSQQATIFVLAFAEGGNTWSAVKDFNPFNVRRSVGVGARVFLPIFGLLGVDWGYGFDKINSSTTWASQSSGWNFHFSIGQSLNGGFN